MENLELPAGVTVLSGEKRSGKTRFALLWANYLAQKNKTLFIAWGYYEAKLIDELRDMNDSISEKLKIDTQYNYLDTNTVIDICKQVEDEGYNIVFFDNIQYSEYNNLSFHDRNSDIALPNILEFIADKLVVKVVLVTEVNVVFRFEPKFLIYPSINNFAFPQHIINKSTQIYYLQLILGNEKVNKEDILLRLKGIHIHCIKNAKNEDYHIKYDNNKLKIITAGMLLKYLHIEEDEYDE